MKIDNLMISENKTVRDAMKKIDEYGKKILFVVEGRKLKGTITDGDIRRWILRDGDFSANVSEIMNLNPKFITENEKHKAKEIMIEYQVEALAILDISGEIISVIFRDEVEIDNKDKKEKIDASVVIMAGGLGSRLYPYTKVIPKPLIPIGDTPIVERIIKQYEEYGCNDFYLTVNYKKKMIKCFFEDFDKAYNVNFLEEDKPLGTGGSLYMLKGKIESTFFVTNCDVLINADYNDILRYHKENENYITMVCAVKNITIPYGIINLNKDGNIKDMKEKPEYSFLTNTGMYVIEPEVLDEIEDNEFMHLPDIVERLREKNKKIGVYPISENSWLDMGQHNEMDRMIKKLGI